MIMTSTRKNHPVTPEEVVNLYDLGYLGVQKDFPKRRSPLPHKNKRNQKLTPEEKEYIKSHIKKE